MESIGAWISKLRDSAIEMAENIAYIRKEIPAWNLPDEIRAAVVSMCNSFGPALCEVPEEIEALHGVVTDLGIARGTGSSVGAVYVLVTESGANILNAFVRVREVEDAIAAGLDDGPGPS